MKRFLYVFLASVVGAGFIVSSVAAYDRTFYENNDIIYYNPLDAECSATTSTTNSDYAGRTIFNPQQLATITELKPVYQKAADKVGIPWQLIAAMHVRESNLRKDGPANGYGPYQITPSTYPVGELTEAQFQEATDAAAVLLKTKAGDRDLSNLSNIKYTFFAYNGTAEVYKTQAKNLGFSDDEANNGEGSPYVMNKYDAERDPTVEPALSGSTWGQIKADYGSIEYPANSAHYGAFVYYEALSSQSGCGGSSVTLDAEKTLAEFATYMKANNNSYSNDSVGGAAHTLSYNGCTTLARWFIGEKTTLTYGRGNGGEVVGNLVSTNSGKITVSDTPRAPSLFSVAGGNAGAWGASGIAAGHVGLVVSVDEASNTATVIHTSSDQATKEKRGLVSTFSYPKSGVTFTYIGDYLK